MHTAKEINLERWRHYHKDLTAPAIYIDMCFYSMIAAALQRRVYLGSDEKPLFPNLFVILVGEPGLGKSVSINPVASMLKAHKLTRMKLEKKSNTEEDEAFEAALEEFRTVNHIEHDDSKKDFKKTPEEPLLFPVAADSTTYEALVQSHSKSLRSIVLNGHDGNKLVKNKIYTHSSLAFVLSEISSLFRRHTEDVVNYLIKAYDCEETYEYRTITRGANIVRRVCLNFLGGTTPGFMKATFKDNLLNEGFASRVLFVYADSNRFERFDQSTFDEEQLAGAAIISDHLKALSNLFGQVTFTPEAYEYMKEYVEVILPKERKVAPPKLIYYMARKGIHIRKLAAAIHFGDHLNMEIGLPSCIRATELAKFLEGNMEHALHVGGRSAIGGLANKILKFLRTGPKSFAAIWGECVDEGNKDEITEALIMLQETGKVTKCDPKSADKPSLFMLAK